MKIRMKFTKKGHVKFVGHLDTVRLFQRAIKVCSIPVAYSQGFNPHPLTYFAMPLSVGVSSEGEYFEIVTREDVSVEEVKENLNKVLPEGITMTEAYQIQESGPSLMSLVDYADYEITIPHEVISKEDFSSYEEAIKQEEIITLKKGKKKTTEVDIKPLVCSYEFAEEATGYVMRLQLQAGSKANLSPELLLKAITAGKSEDLPYSIERKELYTQNEDSIVPLYAYGHAE